MKVTEHITALQRAGERLALAAASAGLDRPVPTCPEWLVRDLLRHISGVHRWATSFVATGRERMPTDEENADYFATVPDGELLSWYRDGLASLVGALSTAQPGLRCWTFLDAPSPLAFWARRQSHETAIHCADAEASAGTSSRFDSQFAADGIDELLGCFFTRPGGRLVADPPLAIGIRATDADQAWRIRIEADRRVVNAGVGDSDCQLSGPASDLYLLLWNRRDPDPPIRVDGDAAVWDLWQSAATIKWS
jgi:uncharacterized protein (TIGR03083 family)